VSPDLSGRTWEGKKLVSFVPPSHSMNKIIIGFLFITAGLAYGSLILDVVYNTTLGYLVQNEWIKPPSAEKLAKNILGRKPTIILYSLILITIGVYILWNHRI
jgi:hypothetical protein